MNILIVGGGKLIYFLSRLFISKGHNVTVINRNHNECRWLAKKIKATIVYGEGSDPKILEEAGAATADAVLAVTPNDEDNLVICQINKIHFKVPQTLALVNDPDNEEVFQKLGITAVFSTTRILSSLIEQRADFEEITNLIPVGEGKINVTEISLKSTSPVIGNSTSEIDLPKDSNIVYILRYGQPIVPSGKTIFRAGDRLIVITLPENHGEVIKKFTVDKD
jgi:trk system potassium uptake protein TrkA